MAREASHGRVVTERDLPGTAGEEERVREMRECPTAFVDRNEREI